MAWNALRPGPRDALAWSVAVLLHALLAFALLRAVHGGHAPQAYDAMPRRAFTVRIAPPRARPVEEPVQAEPAPAPAPQRRAAAPRGRPSRDAAPHATPSNDTSTTAAPAVPSDAGTPDAGMPDAAPQFDRAAASKTVREFAAELNKRPGAEADWKPTRDERLGRAIDASRKSDCRTAYAGAGLFAPLLLARDAVTGSGCKW